MRRPAPPEELQHHLLFVAQGVRHLDSRESIRNAVLRHASIHPIEANVNSLGTESMGTGQAVVTRF